MAKLDKPYKTRQRRCTLGYAVHTATLNPQICEQYTSKAVAKLSLADQELYEHIVGVLDTIEALYPINTTTKPTPSYVRIARDERMAKLLAQCQTNLKSRRQLMRAIIYTIAQRRAAI